jgi:hypothetical protein
VVVAGGDHINKIESAWIDDPRAHAHVRLIGVGVFFRQRIRTIGVNQEVAILPLDQIAALPQPPKVEGIALVPRLVDIGQQPFVH